MSRLTIALSLLIALPVVLSTTATAQESETTTWKGTLDAGAAKLRLEIEIETDSQGRRSGHLRSIDQGNATLPLSSVEVADGKLSFTIDSLGASFSGELSEDGAVAEGIFSQSGARLPLTLTRVKEEDAQPEPRPKTKLKEAWVGKLSMGPVEPVMQFRVVTTESGETAAFFDSVTEGRKGFAAEWANDGTTLRFDVPSIALTYRGTLDGTGETAEGTWAQGGREFPLTLKKQLTEYDDANTWENRPQRPVPPFPYSEKRVTFDNVADGVTLAGTLTLPENPGRRPAVVLITGSGAQDRDESLMGHKPFLVLADYLARRGIAVLRYDDRGTAESTGDFREATTEDFARDASAAVDFLKKQERVDPGEIGLVGHSEGGLVAPMVATRRDDVAFIVLLAATGVDGVRIILSQSEALARAGGADDEAIALDRAVNRSVLEIVAKTPPEDDLQPLIQAAVDEAVQTLPEDRREEAKKRLDTAIKWQMNRLRSKWLRFFLTYDPRPALRKVSCPVLAIVGSNDLQVLPDLNLPEIKKALEEAGNQNFEVAVLPGLNHLFQKSETGAITEYAGIQETFNPAALQKIGDWIVDATRLSD